MVTFNPAWSVVFDATVCAALLWLARMLSRRRPFRRIGLPVLFGAAVLLCVPVIVLGKVFSLVASLVVVPVLVVGSYAETERPLPRKQRIILASLRMAVFALVIICLLRPRLTFTHVQEIPACAVVLADVSGSMEGKDSPPEASRYEALRAILTQNEETIGEIMEECDYRFATFAEKMERADQPPEKPAGRRTNVADAFTGLMRDLGGAKTAGVVLLSDGRDNGLGDPVAAAARLGAPVFAVCLGAAHGAPSVADSSVQNVDCPEHVFIKNIAVITVRVAYTGPETNKLVEVTLDADDKRVDGKRIPMPGPGRTADVELEYVPETEGIKKLAVSVTPADADANVRNNRKEIFVRASESALKVLFIEGEVRWEYKFLRRAIARAENIDLRCVSAFLAGDPARTKLLPEDEDQWVELSLIVLGDIPADRFTPAQLERIKEFVANGGALLMLGGFNTLGPGGYGGTPVGQVLPVDVKADNAQTLDAVRVVPTEDGLEHNILAFGPREDTKQIWESLPPLSGYTRVTDIKPAATALVQTPDGDPILVVQEYEKGRTAVFAADTTWRWIFNEGKFGRYHRAFWRQLVLWLTKSGYGGTAGGIWCETDRLRYLTGDIPAITVRASGTKVENARITAVVEGPDTNVRMEIGLGPGQYDLNLPNPVEKSGSYEVTVTATPEGGKTLEAKTKFVVQETDVESDEPAANPELLDEIAQATGGRLFPKEDAREAFAALLERDAGSRITSTTYKRLWDNALIYLVLCGLLCTEWVIRKRRGLE